jgi:hypothetical protein
MPLQQPTKDFLRYLQQNPSVRAQIRAAPGKTLLYAGGFFKPVWQEIAAQKRSSRQLADKELLPDVLARIKTPGSVHPTLLAWAQDLDRLEPLRENGFIAWRALSGIFAANAVGAVSFCVGSPVTKETKVFAATEVAVLARNPNVDANTRDLVAYFQRCVQSGQPDINAGFIAG